MGPVQHSLKDNLTSSYFSAAHKLYSKKARRRIVAAKSLLDTYFEDLK
jgi:hypothetical protein